MSRQNEKWSTPVLGHKNLQLDFSFSEIRGHKIVSFATGSLKKKSKQKQHRKRIPKIHQSRNNYIADPGSDSEYETVDEDEIRPEESVSNLYSSRNYLQQNLNKNTENQSSPRVLNEPHYPDIELDNNSSCSATELLIFDSPSEKNYENYVGFNDSQADQIPSISSDVATTNFPVFQKHFRDSTKYKSYSRLNVKRTRPSPSKISFSPKWVNRVLPKYNSPRDIPSRDSTIISANKSSTVGADWSNAVFTYEADHLWEDFIKDNPPANKRSSSSGNSGAVKRTGSKYSHLNIKSDQYKKFTSPCRELAQAGEDSFLEGHIVCRKRAGVAISMESPRESCSMNVNAVSFIGENKKELKAAAQRHKKLKLSNLPARKKVTSARELEDFKENSGLPVITGRAKNNDTSNLAKARATPRKKSQPKIISVEITNIPGFARL